MYSDLEHKDLVSDGVDQQMCVGE